MVVRKVLFCLSLLLLAAMARVNAQCGTTNIALSQTVTTSSNGAGTSASSVTDGVVSNVWQPSYSADNYAEVDLGASKTVCRVVVKWGRYNAASAYKIQMSTTGTSGTWVDVHSVTSNNPTIGNESGDYLTQYVYNDLTIASGSNTARYIRIWVGTLSGANWFVSDFEVYESTGSNSPPGCSLTNPSANTTIVANTTLDLTANASDPDGTIAEVAFYNGTTLLGVAPQTSQPYIFQWTPTAAGTYSIKAVAKDNNNATGTSLIITVTVVANTGGWGLSGTATTGVTDPYLGTSDQQPLIVKTNSAERLRVDAQGRVFIGTTGFPSNPPSNPLLGVEGFIVSKGLRVSQSNWPDYVFEQGYRLMPLSELDSFIRKNKHLPDVPSVAVVNQEGISVGDQQALLLRKVEELTLYLLEQNRKIAALEAENAKLKTKVDQLKP